MGWKRTNIKTSKGKRITKTINTDGTHTLSSSSRGTSKNGTRYTRSVNSKGKDVTIMTTRYAGGYVKRETWNHNRKPKKRKKYSKMTTWEKLMYHSFWIYLLGIAIIIEIFGE